MTNEEKIHIHWSWLVEVTHDNIFTDVMCQVFTGPGAIHSGKKRVTHKKYLILASKYHEIWSNFLSRELTWTIRLFTISSRPSVLVFGGSSVVSAQSIMASKMARTWRESSYSSSILICFSFSSSSSGIYGGGAGGYYFAFKPILTRRTKITKWVRSK